VYPLPFPDPPLPANESPDPSSESYDVLDEVLALFRANTFFRNFEIQGPADRLLVYGIWFVSDCLAKIRPNASLRDATKDVMNLALDVNFAIPGDPAWPLNQVRTLPMIRWMWAMSFVSKLTKVWYRRCMSRPATGKTQRSSGSTCPRSDRSWRRGYWRGYTMRTTPSRASGG
jgi:hypothetical protein